MFRAKSCGRVLSVVLALVLVAVGAEGQNKHLVLKDGSHQVITKYEIKGDRVRYFSAERYEWEEVPKSLVDWAATEKYEKERATAPRGVNENIRDVDAENAADRARVEAQTPTIAPGIKLPGSGGVYLLDVYQGQPQLAELVQNGGEINKNMAGNILRATINPIASNKQTIELKGANARVQSHVGDPFVYINVDQDQDPTNDPNPDRLKDNYKIVKLEQKKDARVVGAIKTAIYGKRSQEQRLIDTEVEVVQGGPWIKIAPATKLPPGEYAVVEMLGPDKKDMNLFVWDFGVNPGAPSNPNAWKAQPPKTNTTGTDQTPVLRTERNPK